MLKPKCDHTIVRITLAFANVMSVRNGSGAIPNCASSELTAPCGASMADQRNPMISALMMYG